MALDSDLQAEIVRLAQERSAALVQRDRSALDRLLADEFRYTNASGIIITKAEYFEHYVDSLEVGWTAQTIDDIHVSLYDCAAILTCRVHDMGHYLGQPFDEYYRSTYTWAFQGGIWRCAAGQTTTTARPE